MFIFEFIIELLFYTVCGWFGHVVMKVITFGKVDLDWNNGGESVVAEYLGLFSLLAVAIGIAWIIRA